MIHAVLAPLRTHGPASLEEILAELTPAELAALWRDRELWETPEQPGEVAEPAPEVAP